LQTGQNQQLPERIARYAFLQQKQNHPDEAIEQYTKAAELFAAASREEDALFCWERVAQLDPENSSRQLRLAEAAERMGKTALAARAFLRAGQLASVSGTPADAFNLLGRAYKLAPQERSVGLLYAQANLQAGMPCAPQPCWNRLRPPKATRRFSPHLATRSCDRDTWSAPASYSSGSPRKK